MKEIIVNTYLKKDGTQERKNFNIRLDTNEEVTNESIVIPKIMEKLKIDTNQFKVTNQKIEFITKENVIIFNISLKNNNK